MGREGHLVLRHRLFRFYNNVLKYKIAWHNIIIIGKVTDYNIWWQIDNINYILDFINIINFDFIYKLVY